MIDPPVEALKIIIQFDDPTVDCRWSSIKCFVNGVSENVPQVNVQLIVLTCLS